MKPKRNQEQAAPTKILCMEYLGDKRDSIRNRACALIAQRFVFINEESKQNSIHPMGNVNLNEFSAATA